MDALPYSSVRQNLAKTMERVCEDHTPIIVTRKKNESVVIISLEDYEALQETAYLLRSPKNTRRLIEAIAQLDEGRGAERGLVECPAGSTTNTELSTRSPRTVTRS